MCHICNYRLLSLFKPIFFLSYFSNNSNKHLPTNPCFSLDSSFLVIKKRRFSCVMNYRHKTKWNSGIFFNKSLCLFFSRNSLWEGLNSFNSLINDFVLSIYTNLELLWSSITFLILENSIKAIFGSRYSRMDQVKFVE